jgi:hypothetical protein
VGGRKRGRSLGPEGKGGNSLGQKEKGWPAIRTAIPLGNRTACSHARTKRNDFPVGLGITPQPPPICSVFLVPNGPQRPPRLHNYPASQHRQMQAERKSITVCVFSIKRKNAISDCRACSRYQRGLVPRLGLSQDWACPTHLKGLVPRAPKDFEGLVCPNIYNAFCGPNAVQKIYYPRRQRVSSHSFCTA